MALLTADDVHWKQFTATKFREGYDQEEVDEFLDEVVETIASLQEQNSTLKTQLDETRKAVANGEPLPEIEDGESVKQLTDELATAQAQIVQLQEQLQQQAVVGVADSNPEVAELQAQLAASQAEVENLRQQLSSTTVETGGPNESGEATGMLALAQRVHDEYVRNGQEEAEKILSNSRVEGQHIIESANTEKERVLSELAEGREKLENQVQELKVFESDYREKIRNHLKALLEQVRY